MEEWAIDVVGISKSFEDLKAVDNVDLKIKKGEVFGFLGPNGSGKTTMMRILCGLMKPDSGSGNCLGFNILTEQAEIKKRVGYMPQMFSYYKELSVVDNLRFIAQLHGHENIDRLVGKQCERFGLASRKDHYAGDLSGGWKQRLSLAAAMLNKPDLLLLDEPTAGVDPTARRYFWTEIHQLAKRGITVFVSTHFMDEAIRCDRLLYMLYGKKVAEGSQDDLIAGSGLKVFELREDYNNVYTAIQAQFPGASLSVQSGRLRMVVAPKQKEILSWVKDTKYIFEEVRPTIEEVFIYYSGYDDI